MICYAISHYKIINFIANYLFVNILIYMIIYQTQVALLSDLNISLRVWKTWAIPSIYT